MALAGFSRHTGEEAFLSKKRYYYVRLSYIIHYIVPICIVFGISQLIMSQHEWFFYHIAFVRLPSNRVVDKFLKISWHFTKKGVTE